MTTPVRPHEKLFLINQIPLFSPLPLKDKKLIAAVSSLVEYKKGEIVYKKGDPPDGLYCVISGRLRVYIVKNGREEDLEYLKRGKYFGIISMLTGEPHSVNIQAVNDSILLRINKSDSENILQRIPSIAIHFSQTLSRRLKRKDLGEKKIFESTIVSVFGVTGNLGATYYALNLGLCLKEQTNKKVVLLDISKDRESLPDFLKIKDDLKPLVLDSSFLEEPSIRPCVFTHKFGVDLIHVLHKADAAAHLVALLSYLTDDYHYILVDLPGYLDNTVYDCLKQSDVIHLIAAASEPSLISTVKIIEELEKTDSFIRNKTRVITARNDESPVLSFAQMKNLLKQEVFAQLPKINQADYDIANSSVPIIEAKPQCEYSKMVRRVARQAGDKLVGLALGAGAAQGLSHIGILKVIEDNDIVIDVLAGTSMGALIGAFWASGLSADKIRDIMAGLDKFTTLRFVDLVFPRKGLIKGREARRFLTTHLGNKTFYDLKVPLKIVACNIETREEVVIEDGTLVDAVMASIAIPGVFEPVMINSFPLVDGGIINPLPTNVLMRMGVSKIIAVNALPSPEDVQESKRKASNIFDVIVNSIQASEYLLAETSCQDADIAMHPVLPAAGWYEFYEAGKMIKAGREAAMKCLAQLKELARA